MLSPQRRRTLNCIDAAGSRLAPTPNWGKVPRAHQMRMTALFLCGRCAAFEPCDVSVVCCAADLKRIAFVLKFDVQDGETVELRK
jgi:hypothetical protein